MDNMDKNEVKLKVMESMQDDVNKGIVRIDSYFMQQIGVSPGDIVEIRGGRSTAGIVGRGYPGDIGQDIIRTDPLIRRNAKTGIGDTVSVNKAEVVEAQRVVVAPARKDVRVTASPTLFKRGLLGRVVKKGDLVALGGATKRRSAMSTNPFFDEIFSSEGFEEPFMVGFGGLKFAVVEVKPSKKFTIITENTKVDYKPEAVEIKDDERSTEIAYEDIGGLREEIQKIREMVELPLKHPEIFERLGIEAPKGVLLHGPPGTGKTLLAKAVANETRSNFILINGPEIMGKFYGQSLPGDEKVLIYQNGLYKRRKIKDIVEERDEKIMVPCFDKDGKIILGKITDFIKHRNNSKILEVKTRSGRSIKVTDYHSLFSLGKEGIEEVKTSDLIEGKSFVAVPKVLPLSNNPLNEINLLECFRNEDRGVGVRNVQNYIKEAIKVLGREKVSNILKVSKKYSYDIISKNVKIPVSKFMKVVECANLKIEIDEMQICTKGKSFPAILKINEEFVTFLGLWMAEGSYTSKDEVRITIHQDEEKVFGQLCQRLFGTLNIYKKKGSKGIDILICSTIVGKILRYALGFNSKSREKRVPDFIYNLNENHISAFLRGYFSGDGTLNTKTPAPMVEVCTESKELADDIMYLLLYFGIVAKKYERKDRPQSRICFADYENLSKFCKIGFLNENRNRTIYTYVQTQKFSRRDQIPNEGLVKEIIDDNYKLKEWRASKSIGKNILQKLENPLLQNILESDIYWDKVVQIKEVDNEEFVYDIGVDPKHNFIAGFGGIFAHNSEENIRKKFEEAEKNAPSIIFIDEIDAIASKREESHGEVERRVVAQLLTLMDGLKTRGKVVVIAASNIPNLLDPALRRPGRFDREIEIGVPSKKGRLDILKIHTRNMPLDKTINLAKIAEPTHGFVGADLAALAKEAAMIVLRRVLPDLKLDEEEPIPKEVLENMILKQKDFIDALKVVRPSAMREVLVEIPNVGWNDIGGLDDVKRELNESIEWPLKNIAAFKRLGIKPPKGVLLYGPPGTGKTLLAKAVANESEANFILVKGPSVLSKWVGESRKESEKYLTRQGKLLLQLFSLMK